MDVLAPAAGRLLVATPALTDPNFAGTVVLLLDHDADGTLGVVLNRPTELRAAEVLPAVRGLVAEPTVVFDGGPVTPQSAIAVGLLPEREHDPTWFRRVFSDIGLVDLDALVDGQTATEALRVYAGYAGWDAGQLDAELAEGAWLVLALLPSDVFHAQPPRLWRTVLRRQPVPLAYLSTWTPDPDTN